MCAAKGGVSMPPSLELPERDASTSIS